MPPKKRRSEVDDLAGEVKPTVEVPSLRRVTRSLTRGDAVPPSPPTKVASKRKGKKAKTTAEVPKTTAEEEKKDETDDSEEEEEEPVVDDGDAGASGSGSAAATTIIIEHCTQGLCKSFATKAGEVRAGLEQGLPGTRVLINPEPPRKGCFEIRAEGENEQTFLSLLDMKRPFKTLKELSMEEVIADIIEKIQG